MLRYELKKIFVRTSGKLAIVVLAVLLVIVCYFAVKGVYYVNEHGEKEYGPAAVEKLRAARKEWKGEITQEVLARVIEENARINATEEYRSEDVQKKNIAFSRKQGFEDIRNMLVRSYCGFQEYDYYKPDSLKPSDAESFYENRIRSLEEWLDTDSADIFSGEEKEFLLEQYRKLKIPMQYDYAEGWKQLAEYSPSVIMIMVLVLGFLSAGIFAGEFQQNTAAVFYASCHGRGRASAAKVGAGVVLVTLVYFSVMLLYSAGVLGILGLDGADIPIQTDVWKSIYNISFWQEYLLIILGGYLGCLFISLMTVLVSAKTKSAALSAMVPFIFIFLPSLLIGLNIPSVNEVLIMLPDQLMQINMAVSYFNLYKIGGNITGGVWPLLLLYCPLTLLLCPLLYQVFRKAEVK